MIFGVLNPERIWHQQVVHLPTLWRSAVEGTSCMGS